MKENPPIALTVGGIDSSGAAGIHADIKTMTALEVYPLTTVIAVTAQNSTRFSGTAWISQPKVREQLTTVLEEYDCKAIKTGFIGRSPYLPLIPNAAGEYNVSNLIVDPILVNFRGDPIFKRAFTLAYMKRLIPFASCVTPNVHEAKMLADKDITTIEEAQQAARVIKESGAKTVLIKGAVKNTEQITDLFFDGDAFHTLTSERIITNNVRGSGDTLSAAITAYVARGDDLFEAVRKAHQFTNHAIKKAQSWNITHGQGPLNHFPQ